MYLYLYSFYHGVHYALDSQRPQAYRACRQALAQTGLVRDGRTDYVEDNVDQNVETVRRNRPDNPDDHAVEDND